MPSALASFFLVGMVMQAGEAAYRVLPGANFPYSEWPSNVIKYRAEGYTTKEFQALQDAMSKIREETGGCIQFERDIQTTGPGSAPFIQFQKAMPPGGNSAMCWTYPGYHQGQTGRNSGQLAVMFGGAAADSTGNEDGSCLGPGREREAMALLVNILGLYSEYQRDDRETAAMGQPAPMTFNAAGDSARNELVKDSLKSKFIFGPSNRAVVNVNATYKSAFDLNSITMISGEKYAKSFNKPVFSTSRVVGAKARLSVDDCTALLDMYGKYCPASLGYPRAGTRLQCRDDPYASGSAAGPSFKVPGTPEPASITRGIQCASPSASTTSPATVPLVLATLPLDGLVPPTATDTIQVSWKTPVPGMSVDSPLPVSKNLVVDLAVTTGAFGFKPCGTNTPCQYVVNFVLDKRPTRSISVTAAVQVTTGGTAPQTYTVPIQVELNCAPRFESVTANIGPIPNAVQPRTFQAGDGLQEYLPAVLPLSGGTTAGGTRINSQIVQYEAGTATAAGKPGLANYIVNYVVDTSGKPIGEPGQVTGTNAAPTLNKVFVHCIAAAAPSVLAGPNIVAIIRASDPDMDDFSYFTYTGLPKEQWSITPDGVLSVSALGTPVGSDATVTLPNSIAPAAIGGETASIDAYTTTVKTRDVSVVAVDSKGASSILHLRFELGCGQVPN
ncbi:hypothetical protein RvY_16954 [Ramazzottius varieornatus]|uniref:Peptidase M12A domain-containing protein n=1 Tax=Ramazzottius varieornatus TaxID=947166 RepID=A0A1D1W0E4_RAMVA|nr:hypothetical protein RvY_16954 [Ramazzottius varieornatus]